MGRTGLIFKIILLSYLAYLLYFLATTDGPAGFDYHPPFALFILDTINLFIHEAGHFFLRLFGMWIYVFGGSFFQCFVPLLLLIVTWRQNPSQTPYPAFWLGENLVNVSIYIRDAPYRHLRLIAKGVIHDWSWLLSDNLDSAETLGVIVFICGLLICAAGLVAGFYFVVRSFREDAVAVENSGNR